MTNRNLIALAFLLLSGCCDDGLHTAEQEHARVAQRLEDTYQGLAYACGFLNGQAAIMKRTGIPNPPKSDDLGCPAYQQKAALAGFFGGEKLATAPLIRSTP